MTEDIQLRLDPRSAASELKVIGEVSSRLGIDANRIKAVKTIRRSIDARQRRVMINLPVRCPRRWPLPSPPLSSSRN